MTRWHQIKSPPAPYVHAVRTTTEAGLHAIVAIREDGGRFEVWSILDHGTFLKTIQKEAEALDLAGAVDAARGICQRYGGDGGLSSAARASYVYLEATGRMSGPVSREELFAALDEGVLHWESQVWDTRSATGHWQSVDQAVGFAQT